MVLLLKINVTSYFEHFCFMMYNFFMAVYFLYGEEDFNIDIELDKLRSKLNPDFLSMSYRVLDNPDYTDLITALRSSPMMFGSSLTIINVNGYFFGTDEHSFDDKELEDIDDALSNNLDANDIVFVAKIPRDENRKIDTRRKLYKILSKYNPKEFPTFSVFKTAEVSAWIKNRAKEKKLSVKDDAIALLIEHIGTNLRQFDTELEKLKLAAYPENIVTAKMVEDNCISNHDLFNITNYLMKGEKGKAVLEFKQLLDKKHPLEILSALQTMIRQWVIIKANSKSSISEVMKMSGIRNEYRIQKLREDLKNVSLKELVKLKENLFSVEYRIKSGQVLDMETEAEIALIK